MSDLNVPFNKHGLKDSEIASLKKGKFQTVADLLLTPTQDIAKRCRVSPLEAKRIVDIVLSATASPKLERLDNCSRQEEVFTTGDKTLDDALGGGIRTGMVWEVVGESAAGKTQFALQLSLFVQAPQDLGGLGASTCYLTTSSKLPTARLLQIAETNERLYSSSCSLSHVHTLATPTAALLQHVLSDMVPSFVEEHKSKPGGKPIKLLVIDALAELFHYNDKTTTSTLVQRSRDLTSISATLHELARVHNLAVLVLNEVIDSFNRPNHQQSDQPSLSYGFQSRWFNTAEFFGERSKEATLGLVWANQVNTRIMLSRTGRRKYLNSEELPKRVRLNDYAGTSTPPAVEDEQQPTLIRRLSVIFSNVCLPFSLDYVVTEVGVSILPDNNSPFMPLANNAYTIRRTGSKGDNENVTAAVSDNIQPPATAVDAILDKAMSKSIEVESDDHLWENEDSYDNLDWDALEEALSQAPLKDIKGSPQ
ncbi:P-loop containing nucleoside triphosphate hydrolase protein [Pholiota molesta]|nr:P-loop containing nucleoside triphosphate hydrolase protein [Pholiota molesta]